MKPAVRTVLIVALVASLAGVAVLAVFNSQKASAIRQGKEREASLAAQLSSLGQDLDQAKTQLAEALAKLTDAEKAAIEKDTEIGSLQSQVSDLQADKSQLSKQVARAMCGQVLGPSEVTGLSTNQALVEPLTKVVEADYGMASISTWFDTVWNNSKTAVFDIQDQDRNTVKVVVSWGFDDNTIKGVYNINLACFYYLP